MTEFFEASNKKIADKFRHAGVKLGGKNPDPSNLKLGRKGGRES